MVFCAKWIGITDDKKSVCPIFKREWKNEKKIKKAVLYLTALGIYEARLNGNRISNYVLAPGWTSYEKRHQYQEYDVTELVDAENILTVTVGNGWFRSTMPFEAKSEEGIKIVNRPCGLFGELHLIYDDDSEGIIFTDSSWQWGESAVRFSEIYDGEIYDASFTTKEWKNCVEIEWPTDVLIPQEGEEIREIERICAKKVFTTPKGEVVVDFGQEVTGYVEINLEAKQGDVIRISHGEVLDKYGNFYNENYRTAKAEIVYHCKDGWQRWHPMLTFFGFRYIKLTEFPGEAKKENFTAIVVCSDIRKTGDIRCSNEDLNQLFSNILWGQKGNFLDIPTDCPQRDERLGWTGDAQVFVKAASYNYDVEKFFRKWLRDLAVDQGDDGKVSWVVPDYLPEEKCSAAWGDAATICPWQIYMMYGNVDILREQFSSMKKWVDYITSITEDPFLWIGSTQCNHFGDWLGLDAAEGSYKGSSDESFIATAFYAYSTSLVIKAGKVLNEDVSEYEKLYEGIVTKFREVYPVYHTQTEHVLAIQFQLAENPEKTASDLASMIQEKGHMCTGFLGTPYLLHVLSRYGYKELAYSLLLREEYPSWLYSVKRGATTIWEHWDGIKKDGEFWSSDMNSFNHYAYGAVADWIYEEAGGIKPEAPGFKKIRIEPKSDSRLKWLEVSLDTRQGKVRSMWKYTDDGVRYEIETPVESVIVVDGKENVVNGGKYIFYGENN